MFQYQARRLTLKHLKRIENRDSKHGGASQVVDHVLILTALHFHKTPRSEGTEWSVLAKQQFIVNGFYLTA
jgi:hypothetical protein